MACPICGTRKPKRFCPAEGEKICAICCGTAREVTIDCPSDCPYLVAARRYEREHQKPLPADQMPFPEVRITGESVRQLEELIVLLCRAVTQTARESRATDDDSVQAHTALAEAYRTLEAGIYYEHPPEGPLAQAIYAGMVKAVDDLKQAQTQRTGFASLKDGDVFRALVFLLRVGKQETGGRPRSRAFLDFVRTWIPAEKTAPEPSRIISA